MPFPCPEGHTEPLHPWVDYLVVLLTEQGRLGSLDAAVKASVKDGISELTTWKIFSGLDFLQYASCLLKYWVPSENNTATFVYEVLTVFYYIFDHAEMKDLQTPIEPSSIGPDGLPIITPLSKWIIKYAKLMGEWLSTPKSITPESYQSFWNPDIQDRYRMADYLIPNPSDPVGGFKSFNELFCRFLKEGYPYPNVRPIVSIDDPNVVVFPADSTFDGHWNISDKNVVTIKNLPWPISALLEGSKPEYIERFKDGIWCHAFLNTFDYHRQHAPVAGKIVHNEVIEGLCYLEVVEKKDNDGKTVLEPHRPFQNKPLDQKNAPGAEPDAPDSAGYEFIQRRGCIIIDTGAENGLVAVLPIGMAQVSSIKLSKQEGDMVKKGEEISWFEFGGSDIVLVFEKKADPKLFALMGVHHLMGQKLCHLHLKWPGGERAE